jgi:hypothetical protein
MTKRLFWHSCFVQHVLPGLPAAVLCRQHWGPTKDSGPSGGINRLFVVDTGAAHLQPYRLNGAATHTLDFAAKVPA